MRVTIENNNKLQRDTSSMAVINTDKKAKQELLARRKALLDKDAKLEELSRELQELKAIVLELKNKG